MKDTEITEIVGCACDWLTVTTINPEASADMSVVYRNMVHDLLPEDVLAKNWSAMGYKGQSYGNLKFGRRNATEAILIASGPLANDVMLCYEIPSERVKRIDIQVTVRLERPDSKVAKRLQLRSQDLPDTSKYSKLWTYHSSPIGDTFCVGKRGKPVYVRFYDKSLKLGEVETGRCWRYEVEYRQKAAEKVALNLNRAGDPRRYITSQVWGEFKKRGVVPMYDVNVPINAIEIATEVTGVDAKLGWLTRCVAPVVTQLSALGYEGAVIDSLGLGATIRKAGKDD